ncbi:MULTISPECIES: DMT family transporter [Dietzia]|uniref:SMR family transporter n=1 Tax=Dietzia cercidiphylli TaxID=498199 RepID=A0ABN2IBS4_9ACTN|nr:MULTISPECIES: SMR family transporter [Dietzia]MBB1034929.1 QacE family quaternary ammonium compound efflux SMR transporter [Dietzia sp. CQ4]MBB1036731.1 QacE family quaternary ammonium compound efflux SMR transporter [Dietzia natronolimnaea]MBB1041922.1 QacE family quaternary ammonium compound efflux SMR transporter [Dietzia sp. Cai40]MBB1043783.1 QacE family quaternary ammonium compound efflux SMR transporter [Dietzia sp. DQ11-44]MBB1048483.1 QacE family quaternary ammonium compound efflux
MAWAYLAVAISFELAATLSLRMAVDNARWYAAVVPGYLVAFVFLSLTLAEGMPLGVAYGIWTAAGVALAAVLSRLLFREPLTPLMGAGIVLIAGGVLLVELGAGV